MKKIIVTATAFLMLLCFVSCSSPMKKSSSRKNGLGSSFEAKMSISLDRLQAEGTLRRFGDGLWEAEFDTPNTLSGVKLSFSEGNVTASYKGLSFSVPQSALPVKAMMLNLIEAVDENARLEELKGEEKDDTLEISGKLEGGDYVLIVDKEGKLIGFEMSNNKLVITLSEHKEISGEQPSTEQSSGEETTSPESTAPVTTKNAD